MFDKIEFSDIYKFISSIGIVLIVAAVLIPLFIFQIDLVKNYKDVDVSQLTVELQETIEYQNKALNNVFKYWWIISGLLFIAGIAISVIGVLKWKTRQDVIDKLQDLDLLEKEKLIQEAPISDVAQKIEEDAEEINETNQDKELFKEKYKTLEKRVIESIDVNNQDIQIRHNAKVGSFVYDLIIIKRISLKESVHKVCEIKYYQKEIFYSYIQHGVSSFLLSISNYLNNLSPGPMGSISSSFYIIWICNSNSQLLQLHSYAEKAKQFSRNKGVNLNIIITLESNIEIIKDELLK